MSEGNTVTLLFPTPGHQSARIRLPDRDVVLASDCCYVREVLDQFNLAPGASHDRDRHLKSLQQLRELRQNGSYILFGHDKDQPELTAPEPVVLGQVSV